MFLFDATYLIVLFSATMDRLCLVVVGASCVGKSAFTRMFIHHIFQEYYEPTLEDVYTKAITVDSETCLLQVTDTSGLVDVFMDLLDNEIRSGDGFICMYSVTDLASYDYIDYFVKKIKIFNEAAPILLVKNKCDVSPERWVVNASMDDSLSRQHSLPVHTTSAKTGNGVKEAFDYVVQQVREKNNKQESSGCCKIC